jgi:hypothetical protein
MSNPTRFEMRSWRRCRLIAAGLALLVLATAGPAAAERHSWEPRGNCPLEGTWLCSVDIGALFFTQYGAGATGTDGTLTVEWIGFDPTLFGNFPTAVRVTQAMGSWEQQTARAYRYTWVAYGFDAAGTPLYAIRGSGTGSFDECDTIVFDWVMEVFPYPLNPLVDEPVACMSGTGSKQRIPVVQATCDD